MTYMTEQGLVQDLLMQCSNGPRRGNSCLSASFPVLPAAARSNIGCPTHQAPQQQRHWFPQLNIGATLVHVIALCFAYCRVPTVFHRG